MPLRTRRKLRTTPALFAAFVSATVAAQAAPDFHRDVAPIFEAACHECHGFDKAKGGLRMGDREAFFQGGDSGAPIVPGDPDASLLIQLVRGTEDGIMPPKGQPLPPEKVAILEEWVRAGALWPETPPPPPESADAPTSTTAADELHWSFRPVRRPDPPTVATAPERVRNPIDAFVLDRLAREGIAPSPEADRRTLVRRLHLDLIGLPPSPEEVRDFVTDDSPYAYEALVTRLLASPHFGERWGRHWLDVARYADSDGYEKDTVRPHAWRYRDWVVDAFNRDLPYDRFVVEQLAGDLLPDPTTEQIVATGFHRNTLTNKEGGVDQEEFRTKAVVDRTNTTGLAFLGLTVGCAECHSHKYDPISQREYYGLYAFFNDADEKDVPAVQGPALEAWRRSKEVFDAKANEARAELAKARAEVEKKLPELEAALDLAPVQWKALAPAGFLSAGGATFDRLLDGSIRLKGATPPTDRYTAVVPTDATAVTGFRLDVLADDALPARGPGRAEHGNFVLNEFRATQAPAANFADATPVKFASAAADYSQEKYPVADAIDGKADTGWAIGTAPGFNRDRTAIFATETDAGIEGGTIFAFELDQNYGSAHTIGRFRISLTTAPRESLAYPPDVLAALATEPDERDDAAKKVVLDFFAGRDPRVRELDARLRGILAAEPPKPDTMAQTLVQRGEPRDTRIHVRGDFLRPGDPVAPDTLAVLPPIEPRGGRPDRLDLAEWIADPKNPLTARVEVNRVWARLFGEGLVATPEDFGTQGEPPSHPELLDWLADEFVRLGWSRKRLIETIVSSSTYRQISADRPELRERDPKNRLLARQGSFRVEAEIVRDLALSAGGILHRAIGGPSVRPQLPSGVADLGYARSVRWTESPAPDKYRRGLYIFFQRTVPYPMLMTFDCPDSNVASVRRPVSNTPLQALTVLNSPAFVECAQAFGARLLEEVASVESASEGEAIDAARIARAFEICMAREPDAEEAVVLRGLLEDQRAIFAEAPEKAKDLAGGFVPEGADPVEAAAWVALGRVLLNADEFLTRD